MEKPHLEKAERKFSSLLVEVKTNLYELQRCPKTNETHNIASKYKWVSYNYLGPPYFTVPVLQREK